MMKELERKFEEEMEVIRDETPVMPLDEQLEIAKDRLTEKLAGYVARIADNRKAGHDEAVNLAFFN